MDVTLTGPFQGLLTVKGTSCQVEVRLMDSSPIMFFVPYGEKCAIKVDYLGRALFTLLISEQKTGDLGHKIYYDVKERTMLCQYYVNAALNIASDPRLGTGKLSNEIVALERSFYPVFPGVFQSNILQIE
ncbi:hypothetical protein RvY_13651-3 [Ramazzottius varieornatus]|nr:hypothetical protein RvY_13651-3 [Ramazzottius varieornatus]